MGHLCACLPWGFMWPRRIRKRSAWACHNKQICGSRAWMRNSENGIWDPDLLYDPIDLHIGCVLRPSLNALENNKHPCKNRSMSFQSSLKIWGLFFNYFGKYPPRPPQGGGGGLEWGWGRHLFFKHVEQIQGRHLCRKKKLRERSTTSHRACKVDIIQACSYYLTLCLY